MENTPKIALITDSGTNTPAEVIEHYGIYCAYLSVNYSDAQYREVVEISTQEVYERFEQEIPHTSTPSPQDVAACIEQAIADGNTHILCVLTSSGLSSTCSLFESALVGHPEVTSHVVDTKSIGAGGGIGVIYAAELIEQGLPFDEICSIMDQTVLRSHVYFLVDTLDNLYKGGRINKAVYSLGSILNLKPVITCHTAGAGNYIVAAKTRGRVKALKKQIELVKKDVGNAARYRIGFASGITPDRAELFAHVQDVFKGAESIRDFGDVSPALITHTGPGLVGITCQVLA
ncbi:MAG: DegV family protein [Coriobacteriia bacterium]|nr:DegV family protein [Coriobacteriia bacterium]